MLTKILRLFCDFLAKSKNVQKCPKMGDKVCEKVAEKCLDKNSEKSTKLFFNSIVRSQKSCDFLRLFLREMLILANEKSQKVINKLIKIIITTYDNH
jgi:hypothetical protein